MPNFWILKTEPEVYSFAKLAAEKVARWDGIRNFQARNNLKAMAVGDVCLIYHGGDSKEIVGEARVVKAGYPDPSDGEWVCVDLEAVREFGSPVTLSVLKEKLPQLVMVRQPRLSVSPALAKEYEEILRLAGEKDSLGK